VTAPFAGKRAEDEVPMTTAAESRIDPATSIGAVRLTVADVVREQHFYEQAIGLETLERSDSLVRLGAGGDALVELAVDPDAPPRPPRTTGLFHLAILVPNRPELARSLWRVVDAGWRLTGASDHLVSEALYLKDPEGNGIEIYRDRSRDEWRYSDGRLEMATLPLDLDNLVAELGGGERHPAPVPAGTRIGHVHLNVSDLDAAEAFYSGALGLDVTVRGYPGALFLSAGGYHHHVGLNTWAGEGAPSPPPGARGLAWYELRVPGPADLEQVTRRLAERQISVDRRDGSVMVEDPSGNRVLVRAR
jgi:catechol 2,3-dioxygenase